MLGRAPDLIGDRYRAAAGAGFAAEEGEPGALLGHQLQTLELLQKGRCESRVTDLDRTRRGGWAKTQEGVRTGSEDLLGALQLARGLRPIPPGRRHRATPQRHFRIIVETRRAERRRGGIDATHQQLRCAGEGAPGRAGCLALGLLQSAQDAQGPPPDPCPDDSDPARAASLRSCGAASASATSRALRRSGAVVAGSRPQPTRPRLGLDRRPQVDDPAVREGMVKALAAYTAVWRKGCTPPDSSGWTNIDNNKAFLAQTVVSQGGASRKP